MSISLYLYQQNLRSNSPYQQLGGDFALTGVNGPVSLSDVNRRSVVLMFGYTSCPDACPTGLANVGADQGYVRATPPGVTIGAAFMTLHNSASLPVSLQQVSSPSNTMT